MAKKELLDFMRHKSSSGGLIGAATRFSLRIAQAICAVAVAALYSTELRKSISTHTLGAPEWIFAEVLAGVCLVTSLAYCNPYFKSYWTCFWDLVLFVAWFTLFGIFAHKFIAIHPSPEQSAERRMKRTLWLDLANAAMWFISGFYSTLVWSHKRFPTSKKSSSTDKNPTATTLGPWNVGKTCAPCKQGLTEPKVPGSFDFPCAVHGDGPALRDQTYGQA